MLIQKQYSLLLFTGNLDQPKNAATFLIIEENEKPLWIFFKELLKCGEFNSL